PFLRLGCGRKQRGGPRRAPRRAALGDHLAQSLRRCPEERRAGSEVELLRCRIGLEEGVDPVLERAALAFRHALVHLAPLVERYELDGSPDVDGVPATPCALQASLFPL